MTTALSTKDARKALVSAYHNRRVVTWEDRKLIREATQGLSRFEAPTPAPRKQGVKLHSLTQPATKRRRNQS